MRGLSGTTATLQAGCRVRFKPREVIVGAGLTAAGAAATLGGSAAVQAAIDGTRVATEGATAVGGLPTTPRAREGLRRARRLREEVAPIFPSRRGLHPPRWRKLRKSFQSRPGGQSNRCGFVHRNRLCAQDDFAPQGQRLHAVRGTGRVQLAFLEGATNRTAAAADDQTGMRFSAVAAITNNLVAARFWMILALLFLGMAVASPYFTVVAMRAKEKVVILDPGGTLIYAPLLGFEQAGELHAYHVRLACLALLQRNPVGPDLPDLLKRLYLEPARKKAAAIYQARNPEFKERQIHQKVEVTKIDILDTRQIKDGTGHSYEAVTVRTEGNLIRTGTLNKMNFANR